MIIKWIKGMGSLLLKRLNSFNYPYMVVLDIAKASVANSFTHVRESAHAVLNATTLS